MTEQSLLDATPSPVRLRVEDYLLLDEAGALESYTKTELLDGDIFYMNAQHRPHARLKTELAYRLGRALEASGTGLHVLVEASIAIPPHSAPEPDILLTSEPDGDGLVPVSSVALIAEIADTTLDSDLSRKAAVYAAADVPEYWVADVNGRIIHQMWSPAGARYEKRREAAFGAELSAATITALSIGTGGL